MRVKSLFATLIRHLSLYLKNSPRARHLVLRLLAVSPWLSVKCRRLYLRNQLGGGQPPALPALPNTRGPIPALRARAPLAQGVNASQRSPLETHFHNYVEPE